MESTFVDRIQWSQRTYTLRMLLEFRRPPCIVSFPEGHRGNNEVENLKSGLVVRIQSVFAERRVFARSFDGRVFSIPETFPIKFEVVKKSGKKEKAKRLDEILRNYRPPILVSLDRKNNKWNFRNGKMVQSEDSLGTLILFKAYFEHFARANQLINGVIVRRIFLVPLYLDLDVRLAEGYKNKNSSEYTVLMRMLDAAVQSLDYKSYTGLNAILVFDPSVGSIHPLAASRLHSRTNSSRGDKFFGENRTLTDEHTGTAKSSLPSGGGSHGRSRSGGSKTQRRRAQSEDFLGKILLEQTDGRTDDLDSTGNRHSSRESVFEGHGGSLRGTGSRSLNRRKGRSAEELQMGSIQDEAVLKKAASTALDQVKEDPYGRIQKDRRRKTRNMDRTSVSLDHLNYIQNGKAGRRNEIGGKKQANSPKLEKTGSGGKSRRSGQGQTLDEDATVSSIQSRTNREDTSFERHGLVPIESSRPLPKPRGSRTGQMSEDSFVPEPRTRHRTENNHVPGSRTRNRSEDSYVPEPRTRHRTEGIYNAEQRTRQRSEDNYNAEPHYSRQVSQTSSGHHHPMNGSDTHYTQHPSQTTPASPHPNYHIHINIQSPQTSPTQEVPTPPKEKKRHTTTTTRRTSPPPPAPTPPPPPASSPPKFRETALPYGAGTLHMGSGGTVVRTSNRVPHGTADGRRRNGPVKARGEDRGRMGRQQQQQQQVLSDGTARVQTTNWNNNTASRSWNRDPVPQMQFKDKSAERKRQSSRAFVSSVSCPGADFIDQEPTTIGRSFEGQKSNRLSSKVIQLQDAREPRISDKEISDIHLRQSLNRQNNNNRHYDVIPFSVRGRDVTETLDVNNNNVANYSVGTSINAKYQYQFVSTSSTKDNHGPLIVDGSRQGKNTRQATNIEVPAMERERFKVTDGDLQVRNSQQRGQVGRRWVIRNCNDQPTTTTRPPKESSIAKRYPVGTTIAVE